MYRYRFVEIICVLLALWFIVLSVSGKKELNMTASEIMEIVCKDEISGLVSRDREFIRENLGFDPDVFSSFSYYSSDDVMNVNEVFIAVLDINGSGTAAVEAMEAYRLGRLNLFNGYAPEQAALIENRKHLFEGNVIIYIISENADEILSAFMKLF